jgi:NADPH:quinone reductase-like Zn-dependent oxidoreductase
MKAITQDTYGSPDVLELSDVPMPEIADDQVLVQVRATSVQPLDWHYMRGEPMIMRPSLGWRAPKLRTRGADVAGVVEAVGAGVAEIRPGDEVFGGSDAGCAEFAAVSERHLTRKPSNLSFEQAAAVPVAGLTALQGLRDTGRVQSGQKVLVNGAAGGVGHFAVQIAKAMGAEVTGVTSTRNLEMVASIGADRVVDYTREDFTRGDQRYDVVFDLVGNRPLSALRRVITPKGTLIVCGAPPGRWIAPLFPTLKALVVSPFVGQRLRPFLAKIDQGDLIEMRDLIEAGKVTPVVDRIYQLTETAEAMRYVENGHARGKVVITI